MNQGPDTSENMENDAQELRDRALQANDVRRKADQFRKHKNGRNRNRINPSNKNAPGKKAAQAAKTGKKGIQGAKQLAQTGQAAAKGAGAVVKGIGALLASPAGPFILLGIIVIVVIIVICGIIKSGTPGAEYNRMLLTDPVADEGFFSKLFGGNKDQSDTWSSKDTTIEDVEEKHNELANIVNEYIADARAACESKIIEHCEEEGLDAYKSLDNVIDNTWSGMGDYAGGDGNAPAAGGAAGAVAWAKAVAKDNTFSYGLPKDYGGNANRCGCYYCGTNVRIKGKKYEKTYNCITFVSAAYAHGANDPILLKVCKRGNLPIDVYQHVRGTKLSVNVKKTFEVVGRCRDLKKSDLQTGDVILEFDKKGFAHAYMYAGDGDVVESTRVSKSECWGPKSIRVQKNSISKRLKRSGNSSNSSIVLRYIGTGGGSGGTVDGAKNVKTYKSYHNLGSINGSNTSRIKSNGSYNGYSIAQSFTWLGNNEYVVSYCSGGAKNRSQLVKFRGKSKVLKTEKSSSAKHGNGLCYNSRTGKLYSARASLGGGDRHYLTMFEASSLKELGTKKISGCTASSIGYDAGTDRYIINQEHYVIILNSKLKKIKKIRKKRSALPQDSNCYNGLGLCVNQNNTIDVWRMSDGKYCGTISCSGLGEIESVCVNDSGNLILLGTYSMYKGKSISKYIGNISTSAINVGSGSSGGSSGGSGAPGKVNKAVGSKLTNAEAIDSACAWAVAVAKDNDYHYGESSWAHTVGCTFCGTQGAKIRKGGSASEVKNSYCCNPFVTAAYCHGAGAKQAVNCKKASKRINLAYDSNRALDNKKYFKKVKKTKISDLKKGDILLTPDHAMLYIGGGKIAEASGSDDGKKGSKRWNNSIHTEKLGGGSWSKVKKIYRFIGTGKVTGSDEWPASAAGGGGRSIDSVKKAKGMSDTQFKHEKQIWLFMRKEGYSEAAVAGALGNLWFESGYNPSAINKQEQAKYGDNICGIGIEQWSNDRNKNLRAYAKSKNKKWNNLSVQCDFMIKEINKSYKAVSPTSSYAKTKGSQENAYNAAREWLREYVYRTKADDPSWYKKRGSWAKDVYKRYHGVSAEGIAGEGGDVGFDGGGYAVSSRQMCLILSTFSVYENQLLGGAKHEEEKLERKEKVVETGGKLVGFGGRIIGSAVGGAGGGLKYIFFNKDDEKNFKGFVKAVKDGASGGGDKGEDVGTEIGELITYHIYTKVENWLSRRDTVNDLRGIMQAHSGDFFIITYGDVTQDYDEFGNPDGLPYYSSITIDPADIKYIMQNAFGIDPDGIYRTNQVDRDAFGGDAASGAGVQGALEWAKKIAADDRYTYGGSRCHTCSGTAREYVCTTFVKGAYAHGAGDAEVLKWCKSGANGWVSDLHAALKKSSHWKSMGAIPISKMKPGDVIVWGNQHVGMYVGNHKYVAAHGKNGKAPADQISVKSGPYAGWTDIMRYVYNSGGSASSNKILEACKEQAEHMKGASYGWQDDPTVENSAKRGSCVTYVACVLQRTGYLKSGKFVWHNKKGKVIGATSKMDVSYPGGKLKNLKDTLQPGDVVITGPKGSVNAGGSAHIFIVSGKWKGNKPYIWDEKSAKKGLHTYSGNKKVIAVIRLK